MLELPNTSASFYWRNGDEIRLPLPPVLHVHAMYDYKHRPTQKYRLINRQASEWSLVDG